MHIHIHIHIHVHIGMHYVLAADGSGTLTPVAETEFARDRAFGFGASRLAEYIEEKSVGRGLGLATKAAEVHAITIETIRIGGPEAVAAQMLALPAAGRRACSMCTACAWRVCMACARHVACARSTCVRRTCSPCCAGAPWWCATRCGHRTWRWWLSA